MESLKNQLSQYTARQLENFFPDGSAVSSNELGVAVETSLSSLSECFSYIRGRYFEGKFSKVFNPLNGDHYAMYLYRLANTVYKDIGDEKLASKIFLLNKALHGIDAFYKVELPKIFVFVHPQGTILGRGVYKDFFCIYQGCTVGSKHPDLVYPEFSERTILYANSTVLGRSKIGKNVVFGAGSILIDRTIEDNQLVLGGPPNLIRPLEFNPLNSVFF